jgi:dihydroxyacetone kinase
MKKFINHPENVAEEMLQGLTVLNPGVARLSGHKVMIRADINKIRDQQVAIIHSCRNRGGRQETRCSPGGQELHR